MRDPNKIILKKIHNSFLSLSIAVALLSTLITIVYVETPLACPLCMGCVCPSNQWIDTARTYFSMLIIIASFLIISVIVYVARRIIITRPSYRISQEKEFRKYK